MNNHQAPDFEDSKLLLAEDSTGATPAIARQAAARMAAYTRGKFVAFAPHVAQELLERPQWVSVPGAAYYAYGLLRWQARWVPFVHLESLLRAYPAINTSTAPQYALILAYQNAPGQPLQYGAIAVDSIPHSVLASDADFCPLPDDSDMWATLALSCFRHQGQAVPILDSAKIFSEYHG